MVYTAVDTYDLNSPETSRGDYFEARSQNSFGRRND